MDFDRKQGKKPIKTILYNVDIDPETNEVKCTEVQRPVNPLAPELIDKMYSPRPNELNRFINNIRENSPILKYEMVNTDFIELSKVANGLKDWGEEYLSFRKAWGFDSALYKDIQKSGEIMTSFVTVQQSAFSFFERVETWRAVVEPLVNTDILKYAIELQEDAKILIEEKEKVEATVWYQLTIEEYERKLTQCSAESSVDKERIRLLEKSLADLNEAKQLIKQVSDKFSSIDKESPKTVSLRPNITPSQIIRLHTSFEWLFDATLEQWRNVLGENIVQPETSIKLKSRFIADLTIFFHYLHECGLIEMRTYAAICGSLCLFSHQGKPLTTKQIHKPKENPNWPNIGGNYVKIRDGIGKL
jgi:hypothetical protein